MDAVTANKSKKIPGRVNINQAPKTVLLGIPYMTEEMADQIIRENTDAGSAAKYRDGQIEGHVLKTGGAEAEGWLREVRAAGEAWYAPGDARVVPWWRGIEELRISQFLDSSVEKGNTEEQSQR